MGFRKHSLGVWDIYWAPVSLGLSWAQTHLIWTTVDEMRKTSPGLFPIFIYAVSLSLCPVKPLIPVFGFGPMWSSAVITHL